MMTGDKTSRLAVWCGLVMTSTSMLVLGVTPGETNPYGAITNRNAFGIRPPPEPETAPPPAPPAPPPNIFLTGVSHQNGVKKAFFVINRPGAKAPEYETAQEGDEIQDLKIQEVNAKEGKVRVLVGGREVVLNFTDNGLKAAAGPAVAGGGGRPAGVPVPQPVAPVPSGVGAGSGPVVIGRGGVNLNQGAAGFGGVAQPINYPGVTVDASGVPVIAPGQATARPLPQRAVSRGTPAATEQPVQLPSGGTEGGGVLPVPTPPPSRFSDR